MTFISTIDMVRLSAGQFAGMKHVNIYGRNNDIGTATTPETIWSSSGLITPPTAARRHDIKSNSVQDKGTLIETGTIKTVNVLSDGNIQIGDTAATFVTNGAAVGDALLNDTAFDHSVIVSVDSETQITVQPFHDDKDLTLLDTYRVVQQNGTGAAVAHIFGLDGSCNEAGEFIIMNGKTNVATINSYIRINDFHTDLAGSGNKNADYMTATAQTDATVTSYIAQGDGKAAQAFYTVPNGKTAFVTNIWLEALRPGTTGQAMVSAELRQTKFIPEGSVRILEEPIGVSLEGSSFNQKDFKPFKVFKQRTDIWLQCDYVTDNNMIVSGGFDIILVDNE